jgi:RNA polymerase sigma-70 factor, ECF subfamily
MQSDLQNNSQDRNLKKDQQVVLDEISFKKLFNEYAAVLCKYSIRFVRDSDLAEDIVKEVFITLWEKRNSISIQLSLKSYLYTSVKNRSIDYLRSRIAKIRFEKDELLNDLIEPVDFPTVLEEKEFSEMITKAVEQLPEMCGIIFSMRRFGDFTNKQISEELHISVKTVENHISKAIKKLRPILANYWFLLAVFLLILFS